MEQQDTKRRLKELNSDIEFLEKTTIKPWFHFPKMLKNLKAERDQLTAWIEEQEATD